MKRIYTEPELEIRKYALSNNGTITTSTNGLETDDTYENIFEGD